MTHMICFSAGVSVLRVLRALNLRTFYQAGCGREEVFSLEMGCYKNIPKVICCFIYKLHRNLASCGFRDGFGGVEEMMARV